MKKGKSNFFLIAPFALWGCISVWTSNLVRLTDKSAVPYAWASLFFSYGIVAVHYIQVAVSSKGCNNAENEKIAWVQLGLSTLFLIVAVVLQHISRMFQNYLIENNLFQKVLYYWSYCTLKKCNWLISNF